MTSLIRPILLIAAGVALSAFPAHAQSDDMRVTVAGLKQDVAILSREMRALNLEMEGMRRENEQLRRQVAAASSNQAVQAELNQLSNAVNALRRDYRQADEAQKKQIIAEVTKQIEALAKETQAAIDTVADAVEATPSVATPVRFSDDYPKTGVTYTVRSGDTLSKIARELGSTIKHIQNANKIVNPARDLRVGETIFVPISQSE